LVKTDCLKPISHFNNAFVGKSDSTYVVLVNVASHDETLGDDCNSVTGAVISELKAPMCRIL